MGSHPVSLGQGSVAVAGAGAHRAQGARGRAGLALDGLELTDEPGQGGGLVGGERLGGGEVEGGGAPGVGGDARGGAGGLSGQDVGERRQPGRQRLARAGAGRQDRVAAGVGGVRGGDLVRPGALDAQAAVGGHEVGVRPVGPVGVVAGAGRGALEVDEPAVAPADGLQEPSEVACGPVCHGKQCAPPVDGGVRGVSVVGCGVVVSWLATFRASIGWRAWACGALTSAYAPGRDVHESGSSLKVAHSDTIRRASQRPALRPRVPALGLRCRGLSGGLGGGLWGRGVMVGDF